MALEFKYDDNLQDAFDIRLKVFIDEQGFSTELEEFDHDPHVIHMTVEEDGVPIGVSRVFPAKYEPLYADSLSAPDGAWIVGRIAVLPEKRHLKLGSKIIQEAERIAREKGATEMHLHAQCRAMDFYLKNGYEPYGEIVPEEGVDHQWMRKDLLAS